MSVSVAMCTYNGSRFLLEQLASIANQTQPIDELVVCDDCSTDNTIEIIEQFAKTVTFPVRLFINSTNLGSNRNFEKCLSLCKNEIIFLCDQDDVWHSQKVEKMCAFFAKNPIIDAVFSDANIIDQNSAPTGTRAWESISFDKEKQDLWKNSQAFDILLRGYVVTGATLAIRRSIVSEILPIPMLIKELIHDGWIAMWLSLTNRIALIEEPLTNYRIHATQQVGFGQQSRFITLKERFTRPRSEKLAPIIKKYEDSSRLYNYLAQSKTVPVHHLKLLNSRQAHYQMRSSLSVNTLKRVIPVLTNILQYKQHDVGHWWKAMLGDIFE
jgi:glycosyltransferase involved in cell wall biosynthesis